MSILRRCVCLLIVVAAAPADAFAEQHITAVHEGTNLSLALSPDRSSLVVALLGQLWRLPSSGGGATPLTPEDEAARNPRFSPDGHSVVYQRLVGRQWDVWEVDLDNGARRALTGAPFNEREPEYGSDGHSVIFASDREGSYDLWSLQPATQTLTRLTSDPGTERFPSVSGSGEIAYIERRGPKWALQVLTPGRETAVLLESEHELGAPSWRPSGGVVVFTVREGSEASSLQMLVLSEQPVIKKLTDGEDVFAGRAAWRSPGELIYASDGRIWRRGLAMTTRRPLQLFAGVAVSAAAPAAARPELYQPGPHPVRGVTGLERGPDGKAYVFTALGDIWLGTAKDPPRQLTDDPFVDIDPTFTRDGRAVIFASDRGGHMNLWRVALDSRQRLQLTFDPDKDYAPEVSPGGKRVAYLSTSALGPWGRSSLKVLSLDTSSTVTVADNLTGARELRWDADGHAVSVTVRAPNAQPGAPTAVRIEVPGADQPTESARRGRSAPAEPAPSPSLEWSAPSNQESYVVEIGRLFDGVTNHYRRHMDIHVQGNRITAIVGRGLLPLPQRVIEARDQTIIPGLVDLRARQSSLTGERLGRMWLAYGVTTVREVTDAPEEAFERSESWASGKRLGPRLAVAARPPTASGPARAPSHIGDGLTNLLIDQSRQLGFPAWAARPFPAGLAGSEPSPPGRPLEVSPLEDIYQDQVAMLAASGRVMLPTLAALRRLRGLPVIDQRAERNLFGTLFTDKERRRWSADRSPSPNSSAAIGSIVARLVRGGARVAIGSDAPAVPYGLGVHAELALLSAAGIANDQVLRLATAEGALALGLEQHIGTLETGKLADFVVLDGNPLERISETRKIVAVVKNGVYYDRGTLGSSGP
jgi:hypothetical protein